MLNPIFVACYATHQIHVSVRASVGDMLHVDISASNKKIEEKTPKHTLIYRNNDQNKEKMKKKKKPNQQQLQKYHQIKCVSHICTHTR